MKKYLFVSAMLCAAMMSASAHASDGTEPDRMQRWAALSHRIFGAAPLSPAGPAVTLDMPAQADDAAVVPLTLRIDPAIHAVGVDVIIDDNPSPVAAKIHFGPAADPTLIKLQVRIDGFTNVHAVARTADGKLLETSRFVKAAGGCSGPVGLGGDDPMRNIGAMKMRFDPAPQPDGAAEATLLIRHPNYNGMQFDPVTQGYKPARYIDKTNIQYDGRTVLSMETDISISSNPEISFLYRKVKDGAFDVRIADTRGGSWNHVFPADR
ncbi:quinoprotein dehydrogenase-associated SoxYZ-like carrier [Acidomonas methanolica]|uniref:quinoprotein dehydrogenase-associated SoxYZ-like carrier n=1 Tax=Acidomonas methanolica TaxID=437 RepID=UPI002119FA33|nr:quinoprotein dehydrogenase-associated SoxYZ-like carrier [Acidomonas methanolica]